MPRTIGSTQDHIAAGDATAQALRLLAIALRRNQGPADLLRKAATQTARFLRKTQQTKGAIPEHLPTKPNSTWPTILTAAALLHWERNELTHHDLF